MLIYKNNPTIPQSAYTNEKCVSIQHEDNFHLLNLLLPSKLIQQFEYYSNIKEKPQLIIHVLNKYKYTIELELCYAFDFGKSEKIVIKLYQDAQVAEIVYCTDLQQFIRLLGPKICPKVHMQTRSVLNNFLNRWLHYLLKNGYRKDRWEIQKANIL